MNAETAKIRHTCGHGQQLVQDNSNFTFTRSELTQV